MLNTAKGYAYLSIVGSVLFPFAMPLILGVGYPFIFDINMFSIPCLILAVTAISLGEFMLGSIGAALSLILGFARVYGSIMWLLLH